MSRNIDQKIEETIRQVIEEKQREGVKVLGK